MLPREIVAQIIFFDGTCFYSITRNTLTDVLKIMQIHHWYPVKTYKRDIFVSFYCHLPITSKRAYGIERAFFFSGYYHGSLLLYDVSLDDYQILMTETNYRMLVY